jgi:hypothetical protein
VATEFETGLLVGVLIGEGHFGGDGRQPQVTLRMHVRHQALFRWIERTFPGGKLYGPYAHDGRHYYQWMARGAYLRDYLVPLLEGRLSPAFDAPSFQRFQDMRLRYAARLSEVGEAGNMNATIEVETAIEVEVDGPIDPSGPEIQGSTSERADAIFRRLRGDRG